MNKLNQVEGDWKDFVIKMVKLSDIPAILQHLTENFHPDETIGSHCPPDDKFANFMNERIAKVLEKHFHLSFIARHKATNEIAGCQFQFKWTKEEAKSTLAASQVDSVPEDIPPTRIIMNKVMAPLDEAKIALFDQFGVDSLAWNFLASTTRKFRGMGLASEMYRRMVILLRQENFNLVYSVFTSPYSRRCAEKVGFAETKRLYFSSVLDENGKQVLANCGEDDFASVMALKL